MAGLPSPGLIVPRDTQGSLRILFFLHTAPANAEAILRTLREFGFGSFRLTAADFTRPGQIVQLGAKPNRIDLLTSSSGVGLEAARSHREQGSLDGLPAAFVGLEDLLCNKDSTGRRQDLTDAGELTQTAQEKAI